ncbi:MAG TPA: (2E,6E)-farnesyl diphosphate synthase [Oceanospirillales bacterium]|jgi:geranylgeranyl pyrophosphate synthase|nr:(2E,6E)-farnesyl diphosphate synthase [Oleispira sp.]HCM05138.1 (2E,6E)-farnesyl diphosphate synthase [Oceanospirillales bacterium]|tara:strand:- start:1008 stop:1907 length:900 start_codon:yes stop_codon:yes gene_type:complete
MTSSSVSFQQQLSDSQQRCENALNSALHQLNISDDYLADAMAYSLFNGGKRVRPFLVQATAQALGINDARVDIAMAAIEMVHSYSLVHDDLPAMDDDDLRRGQPTCHIKFNEATAILAGDALLTGAFEILADMPADFSIAQRLQLIRLLSQGSGASGMVAGQAIDLASVGKDVDLPHLERMHAYKTGALIRISVLMGAHCGNPDSETLRHLTTYANAIGLAFQVQDDILDIESDTVTLGKQQGADVALNKPTYPALLGLEGAKDKAKQLHQQALEALKNLSGDTLALAQLADYIITRNH